VTQNNALGIAYLGAANEIGLGVPVNLPRAKELLLRAARLGSAFAMERLNSNFDTLCETKDGSVSCRAKR
ncbi:MAG: hypothetical protein FD128_2344, partial [Hyphomonadaceae bacterium]